jgi:hypothetical protein
MRKPVEGELSNIIKLNVKDMYLKILILRLIPRKLFVILILNIDIAYFGTDEFYSQYSESLSRMINQGTNENNGLAIINN